MAIGTLATIAGLGASAANVGFGIYGAVKAKNRKADIPGPTSEEYASQARLSAIAGQLGLGQGLSETEFSRGEEMVRRGGQDIVSQAEEQTRGRLISPALASRLARQAYRTGSQAIQRGRETLTIQDIRAARENIGLALQAETASGQAATRISKQEQIADIREKQFKSQQEQIMANSIKQIIKGTAVGGYFLSQFGGDKSDDPFLADEFKSQPSGTTPQSAETASQSVETTPREDLITLDAGGIADKYDITEAEAQAAIDMFFEDDIIAL